MDFPPVSIITIVYNDLSHIIETMDSVISQDYPCIEYILIDGASTDGTKQAIESKITSIARIEHHEEEVGKSYLEAIHAENPNFHFKFLSQKDDGIYDAMNKGIDLATGEWCNFMNCGDRFYTQNSVRELFKQFLENYRETGQA